MNVINLEHLTKKYSPNIGCFDISIKVVPGEIYGFIGPNGAGKTTVIRQIMGFIKSDCGHGKVLDRDIWRDASKIMNDVGYLAGEVALPPYMTAQAYLKMMASLRKDVKWEYVEKLIKYFDLRVKQRIGKMSKGNKQKVAIISAFMHQPKVLILDEPTSGLDPLMQEKFNSLITKARERGATVFISSHIFGEVEANCDRVGFIKKGRLVDEVSINEIRHNADKIYEVKFSEDKDFKRFLKANKLKLKHKNTEKFVIQVQVPQDKALDFLINLHSFPIESFREVPFNLESVFLKLYEDEVYLND